MTRLEILEQFKNKDDTYNKKGAMEAMKRFGKMCYQSGWANRTDLYILGISKTYETWLKEQEEPE